jgi:hypothetical protein
MFLSQCYRRIASTTERDDGQVYLPLSILAVFLLAFL